ncbi:MAG: MBL fold metallo-hydrolase [Candidatus Limnocylindrales bacterium]
MTEVAPRIRRIGPEIVNSYLVEAEGSVVIVDAGVPRYWGQLVTELAAMGRTFDDVRAVLLTHAHPDHIGFAERARRAGVGVRIHELDAALARGEAPNNVKITGPYGVRAVVGFVAFGLRQGLLRVPKVREVLAFEDGAVLDVPGSPRVIHAPGHTAGMSVLHFPAHDALFVGDALNTYAVTNGRRGPQLSPFNADRAQALASLSRFEDVAAGLVLPGHGAPWRDGTRSAVEAARGASAP